LASHTFGVGNNSKCIAAACIWDSVILKECTLIELVQALVLCQRSYLLSIFVTYNVILQSACSLKCFTCKD